MASQTKAAEAFRRIKQADVTLGKSIGSGGFGGVRLATHKSWGQVAVKEFKRVTLTKEVRKEAEKMLRAIHSPFMVRVMGLFDDHTNLCIVMEYFKYGSLKSFQKKYMDCACLSRKVKMMWDIALGMNYLHTLDPPIVHRDLKLDNVFVGSGFDAKIGDLGLAISITSESLLSFESGSIMGTPTHIPPEVWQGLVEVPDEFWDIYTFAITMYEFLSGKDPWQSFADATIIAVWVKTGHRPNLSAIAPETPSELIDIMKRCWNGTPMERPRFQEIQEEISRVYQSRYKKDLDDADFAIMQRKREVGATTDTDESTDSGWGSLLQDGGHGQKSSLESSTSQLRISKDETIKPQPGTSSTDSGRGSSIDSHTTPSGVQSATPTGGKRPTSRITQLRAQFEDTLLPAGTGQTGGASTESHTTSSGGQSATSTGASSVQQWRIIKEFGQQGDAQGEFKRAHAIAVCKNTDVIVVDWVLYRVYIFSKAGMYKHTIASPEDNPDGELEFPNSVGITSSGQIAIIDGTDNSNRAKYVRLFNVNGIYQRRFCTLSPTEPSQTKVIIQPITVSSADGTILVGDQHRKVVTIHAGSDGTWKQKVNLDITPLYLATNSRHQIIASDWKVRKVMCVDYDGKVAFTLDSFTVDGKLGMPLGLTCGDDDTLYVAVMQLDEKTAGFTNTGHIHQYSPRGGFIQCIIKGLYAPSGITWHNGSIYIANNLSVVILGKS